MKNQPIIATFNHGWATYIEINTPHFKGRILVGDFKFSPNGNPVIPGIGELVDGQQIQVSFEGVSPNDHSIPPGSQRGDA